MYKVPSPMPSTFTYIPFAFRATFRYCHQQWIQAVRMVADVTVITQTALVTGLPLPHTPFPSHRSIVPYIPFAFPATFRYRHQRWIQAVRMVADVTVITQ